MARRSRPEQDPSTVGGPEPDAPSAGPTPLRELARLRGVADDLVARCKAGEAEQVLAEVVGPLAEARSAAAQSGSTGSEGTGSDSVGSEGVGSASVGSAAAGEVVNRLRYVVALATMELGRYDDAVTTCDQIIADLGNRGDPAWLACAHALRGIARQVRGDHLAAVTDLVDAAVLLDGAGPSGQPYIYAVEGLAVGYKDLRLYELALEEYDRAAALVSGRGFNLSRVIHLLDRMLIRIYWGMELDRLGRSAEAREHFTAALELADSAAPLPRRNPSIWAFRLRARVGLCRAMLDDAATALADLEVAVASSAPDRLDEAALARIGLVRAYAEAGQTDRALAEGVRAADAADLSKDPQLVLAAVWEQARLPTEGAPDAVVADYARQLERERWDERERSVRETRDRLASERNRRAAQRMSAAYLTDAPTGLGNRRHLELRLREMVIRAQSLDEVLTLAFVDLDATTPMQALAEVGRHLSEQAAPDGFVARYGGTELVLLTPRRTGREAAAMIRDGMQRAGDQPPTVGIASVRAPVSVAGLVASADEALLAARRSGGGVRLASA